MSIHCIIPKKLVNNVEVGLVISWIIRRPPQQPDFTGIVPPCRLGSGQQVDIFVASHSSSHLEYLISHPPLCLPRELVFIQTALRHCSVSALKDRRLQKL